jgi:hypothetical protein
LVFSRSDGRLIPAAPDLKLVPGDHAHLDTIPAQPYHSDWDGSRLDVGHILDGLVYADGLLDPTPHQTDAAESVNCGRVLVEEPPHDIEEIDKLGPIPSRQQLGPVPCSGAGGWSPAGTASRSPLAASGQ